MQQIDGNIALLLVAVFAFVTGVLLQWWRYRNSFSKQEVQASFIHKEVYEQLQVQADLMQDDLREKEAQLRIAESQAAVGLAQLEHLRTRISEQETLFKKEFENLSNRILEENSQKFASQNSQQVNQLLAPLRQQISDFDKGIRERFQWESQERVSLRKEIEHLRQLNKQLSSDAHNLVSALKGDSKIQGDWGEWQLERLFAQAGLEAGIHFDSQQSFRDQQGNQKRPDYLIHLPDGKQLVIDCKVSLTAYERYFNTEEAQEQEQHIKAHVGSLRTHIRSLHAKNYTQLYQIQTPDYLLLFIPIESAYVLAVRTDPTLAEEALSRNIIIVTTTTLLATLRTVAFVWKQEKQHQNAQEIARQSGLLYDKLCGFVDDLEQIGQRLDQAQNAYAAAFNKLANSKKFGDTLVGRAERIRELGAANNKELPPHLT